MRWLPYLLFFAFIWLEISLFMAVAHQLGVLVTLLLLVLTSVVGAALFKNQGIISLGQLQQKLSTNQDPSSELTRSLAIAIAGGLLLIPGFFTDILGALLLLPPVQNSVVRRLQPFMKFKPKAEAARDSYTVEGEFEHKDHQQDDQNDKLPPG